MTNPGNAVGTNAAYGGRTSVNAFNDDLSAWGRGVMSGWACTPDGGLVVSLGGNGTDRDVAVAEDNVGNKTSINNISGAPIKLTMAAAPGSGTRLDSIVAYVDASPQGEATIVDNYGACGLIVVQGTPSASPVAPTDNEIRSAITSDGASGPTAYYVVLATITMASGTTDITDGEIAAGNAAGLVGEGIITADNIDSATSTDADGWIKVKLAKNAVMYAKQGTFSTTMGGGTWTSRQVSAKPTDLDTSQIFRGIVSGTSSDKAINVCGLVDFGNGKVEIQTQNIYTGSVTSDIYWQAHIIQTL